MRGRFVRTFGSSKTQTRAVATFHLGAGLRFMQTLFDLHQRPLQGWDGGQTLRPLQPILDAFSVQNNRGLGCSHDKPAEQPYAS